MIIPIIFGTSVLIGLLIYLVIAPTPHKPF
jgi:hypothetical protein